MSAAQEEGEDLAAFAQPVAPASNGVALTTCANATAVYGAAGQQHQQHELLHRPVVPALRRDAARQPRAGAFTGPAQEARHRHRIERFVGADADAAGSALRS